MLLTKPAQHTKRLFDPENATVGAFFSFLDIVEHETRCIHEHVAKRTVSQYPGIFREPYYLGTLHILLGYTFAFIAQAYMSSHRPAIGSSANAFVRVQTRLCSRCHFTPGR
jgi:hypothetical protein